MQALTHPRFPLPDDSFWHLGNPTPLGDRDVFWLARAQTALRLRWNEKYVHPTGKFDAHTSAAVCRVQEKIGHKPNGELDRETWDAIFVGKNMDPPK